MCEHGKYVMMNMEVEIDKCLVPLIETLQEYGIITLGCCCGHGEKIGGKKVNNNIIFSAEGAEVGLRNEDGTAKGWKDPKDFNIWSIAIPIKRRDKC